MLARKMIRSSPPSFSSLFWFLDHHVGSRLSFTRDLQSPPIPPSRETREEIDASDGVT